MGSRVSAGLDLLSGGAGGDGAGFTGLHPMAKGFSLQKEKWHKEVNTLYVSGEGCAGSLCPMGELEGLLVRNSSWEGPAQLGAAQGVRGPVCC